MRSGYHTGPRSRIETQNTNGLGSRSERGGYGRTVVDFVPYTRMPSMNGESGRLASLTVNFFGLSPDSVLDG